MRFFNMLMDASVGILFGLAIVAVKAFIEDFGHLFNLLLMFVFSSGIEQY